MADVIICVKFDVDELRGYKKVQTLVSRIETASKGDQPS